MQFTKMYQDKVARNIIESESFNRNNLEQFLLKLKTTMQTGSET